MSDYYTQNLLRRIEALERRLAALERQAGGGGATTAASVAAAQPEAPVAVAGLFLAEETTGDIYRLTLRAMGGVAKLLPVWVRSGGGG